MMQNPILEELRRAREELLAKAGGTMAGLVAQLQQDELESGRKVLDLMDLPRNRRSNDYTGAGNTAVSDRELSPTDR